MGYRFYLESLKLLNSYEDLLCLLPFSFSLKDNQESTFVSLGIIVLTPNIFQAEKMRKFPITYESGDSNRNGENISMLKPWTKDYSSSRSEFLMICPIVEKCLPQNKLTLVKKMSI